MASETVRKIGFTGSTAVGKSLMAQAANVRAGQGRGLRVGGRARRLWPVRIPW
jgi:acyl-CoA reductase-like NAD-dependent aldehyde dehydrogenase